jgi:hypothetical protein
MRLRHMPVLPDQPRERWHLRLHTSCPRSVVCGSGSQASLAKPGKEARLARVPAAQLCDPLVEQILPPSTHARGPQVLDEPDRCVVATRLRGPDQAAHLLPGLVLPQKQRVEIPFASVGGTPHVAAGLREPSGRDPYALLTTARRGFEQLPCRAACGVGFIGLSVARTVTTQQFGSQMAVPAQHAVDENILVRNWEVPGPGRKIRRRRLGQLVAGSGSFGDQVVVDP